MHMALLLACSGPRFIEGSGRPTDDSSPPKTDDVITDDTSKSSGESLPTDDSVATDDSGPPPPPPSDAVVLGHTPRNLLVISLDTTRRDHLGFFSKTATTPNLEAAFSGGVILEDHRSCSNWTAPSTYCAQSGNFELDADVWPTALSKNARDPLVEWPPADAPTLASILTDAGFETTLLTTNSMFSLVTNGGGYGFQTELRRFWQNGGTIVNAALAQSAKLGAGGKRWYFHIHFIDPHESYDSSEEYYPDKKLDCPWNVRSSAVQSQLEGGALWIDLDDAERAQAQACLMNAYDGELNYWDQELARMWSALEKEGLLDDTLVVFWTDHGQSFGEHDEKFNHGVTLYDTENRSTAAFWAKDIEPLRWSGPTTHQDLAPTILKALDVPLGDHTGVVAGHASEDRIRVSFDYLVGYSIPLISAIQGDRKLMYWWDGTKRFYDLGLDPDEVVDLYDPSDPDVIRLWNTLQPIVEHTDEVWPGLNPTGVGP